jgi:hypothetical protein
MRLCTEGGGKSRMTKQPMSSILLPACFCVLALGLLGPSTDASEDKKPRPVEFFSIQLGAAGRHPRTLLFPRDYSLGAVLISKLPRWDGVRGQAAQGKIVVPPGMLVRFIPAQYFYKDPSIINTFPADSMDSIHFSASSMDDAEDGLCNHALSYVGHMKGLIELDLDRSDASDAGMAQAAKLPNLQKLTAFEASTDGKCLKQFSTLKQLRYIRLAGTSLKDENLRYLAAIPQLQYLYIGNCKITDVGIKYLANCSGLISLNVMDNPDITDKSIPALLALKKLRYLSLGGTSISTKGILALKGLPLQVLNLPSKYMATAHGAEFSKAFPGVMLTSPNAKNKAVDSETKALWAPLH